MRICVIGHSSTSGFGLPDARLAWPYLVAAELEPLVGEPVEVVNVPFVPVGSKAVPYALAKVEESQPDTVVVSLGAFMCAVGTVKESIRRRFGERAATTCKRVERRFQRATVNRGGLSARLNRGGRLVTRAAFGTATITSVDEVEEIYCAVISSVCRHEGWDVYVQVEPAWPPRLVRDHGRKSLALQAELFRRIKVVADRQHLPWVDTNLVFESGRAKDDLYLEDGVHKTVEGQRRQAKMMVDAIVAARGLAAPGGSDGLPLARTAQDAVTATPPVQSI